ncbi:MAG: peptidase, partial [Hadesarchaea archaeon]|nr:peptidase [Hadesarchaea archaeon]
MEEEYPTLSLKERDRRWINLRELMKKEKMDCLVVAGLRSREQFDRYITNDLSGGFVIFPIEGEPISLLPSI